jgi:hypothetical protein
MFNKTRRANEAETQKHSRGRLRHGTKVVRAWRPSAYLKRPRPPKRGLASIEGPDSQGMRPRRAQANRGLCFPSVYALDQATSAPTAVSYR